MDVSTFVQYLSSIAEPKLYYFNFPNGPKCILLNVQLGGVDGSSRFSLRLVGVSHTLGPDLSKTEFLQVLFGKHP